MIRRALLASSVLIGLALLASLYGWQVIPDGTQVATHWNLQGQADGWSSKTVALLAAPGVMLLLTGLLSGLPLIMPERENLEAAWKFYLTAWLGSLAVALVGHVFIIHAATASATPSLTPVVVALALFLVVTGNYMAKSKPNWIAGVRTPWSLTNEDAWIASNRAAGWGFVASGIMGILAAFVSIDAAFYTLLGGMLAASIYSIWKSYAVWKKAQS